MRVNLYVVLLLQHDRSTYILKIIMQSVFKITTYLTDVFDKLCA